MRKIVIVITGVLMFTCSTLSLSGCKKKEPNVKIVRNEGCSEQSTVESEVDTEESFITEEPIVVIEEPTTVKPSSTDKPVKSSNLKPTGKPAKDKKQRKENINDGDVSYTFGTSSKFINNSEFYITVPKEVFTLFSNSVPDDILDEYPDLTFVHYDKDTKNIYAKSDEYYFEFEYSKYGYSTSSTLKEYADWWTFDE